ncbi:hypothetical protein GpartN1_g1643.t1 [Galdieria partita]|uniref:BZIP domain-containing protein n=1 Tax=Galdieria partita TaxID=83374 RepID=A0A9C7PUH3_9RHOD|nr:hypothetical protein GpartN1_g1643.t1 [Galdieria partita]
MSISEQKPKLISVASLLNPFLITTLNVWDESSTEILKNADTHTKRTWKHTTVDLIQTVTTTLSPSTCESRDIDISLRLETKSCRNETEVVKKNRRGRLPMHPEMSAEERTLWRIYRNRQSAAKSRQKQKEHILYLEKLLKNAEFSNLLLNRTCIVYANIIQQLQQQVREVSIGEKITPLHSRSTEIVSDH